MKTWKNLLVLLAVGTIFWGGLALMQGCNTTSGAADAVADKVTGSDGVKTKATQEVWISVIPGLPIGSTHRLGGYYRVYYQDVDPFDQLKSNVVITCTYIATVAILAILGSLVLAYFNAQSHAFPFWKDILIPAAIILLGSFAIALVVQYMWWIIIGCGLGFGGYWIYVMWRKQQDELIHKELVITGEVQKAAATGPSEVRKKAMAAAQSPLTVKKVNQYQPQAKKTAAAVLAKISAPPA